MEAVLKEKFLPLRDSTIRLTVDENRVYRVIYDDDQLDSNRQYCFNRAGQDVTYKTYAEAAKDYKDIVEQSMRAYNDGLRSQATPEEHAKIREYLRGNRAIEFTHSGGFA